MSLVCVTNVVVARNPGKLSDPFEFEISLECLEPLEQDIDWHLVYVGDAEDKTKDQELDCVALGPIQRGSLRFVFQANAPDFSKINKEDIPGITVILLTGTYKKQEFVRVGWYVHNSFVDELTSSESLPILDVDEMTLDDILEKMQRRIISEAPRVTRFQIKWDTPSYVNQNDETTINNLDSQSNIKSSPPAVIPNSNFSEVSEILDMRMDVKLDCGLLGHECVTSNNEDLNKIKESPKNKNVHMSEDIEMS